MSAEHTSAEQKPATDQVETPPTTACAENAKREFLAFVGEHQRREFMHLMVVLTTWYSEIELSGDIKSVSTTAADLASVWKLWGDNQPKEAMEKAAKIQAGLKQRALMHFILKAQEVTTKMETFTFTVINACRDQISEELGYRNLDLTSRVRECALGGAWNYPYLLKLESEVHKLHHDTVISLRSSGITRQDKDGAYSFQLVPDSKKE